jgi:hypothetical protein
MAHGAMTLWNGEGGGGGGPKCWQGKVLRQPGMGSKHTRTGKAIPARVNLEGIAWKSKGKRGTQAASLLR